MPDRAGLTRLARVSARAGFRMPDAPISQGEVIERPARRGKTLAAVRESVSTGATLFGQGDLLEGIVAAAALLMMVAIGVAPWLAIPLAVVTYIGVALIRPQREHQDEAVDDSDPEPVAVESTVNDGGRHQLTYEVTDEAALACAAAAQRFGLTRREREILPLLAQRLTDREIAEQLCISHRTAMNHVASILNKLDVASRRDVAAFAAQHGLLPPSLPPNTAK